MLPPPHSLRRWESARLTLSALDLWVWTFGPPELDGSGFPACLHTHHSTYSYLKLFASFLTVYVHLLSPFQILFNKVAHPFRGEAW